MSGTIAGLPVSRDPASDDLRVINVTFTKAFNGPSTATGMPVLTFTITNLDQATGIANLGFTDNLNATLSGLTATGLPASNVCGAGSQIAGTSLLTFTGGNLGPGAMCMFNVNLQVPPAAPPGNYLNTTSDLLSAGLTVADPASDTLVVEPPPAFGKNFAPNPIPAGTVSTLTFTIDNSASALAATNLDFTDNLPGGVVVATPPNASTTCTGGTVTAGAGTGVISYSGGSVAAGASCMVFVDVTAAAAGMFVNTTGDLTSSSGNSGPASDTLNVDPASADLSVGKTDSPDPVAAGANLTYTISFTNMGPSPADMVTVTDPTPAGTTFVSAVVSSGMGWTITAPAVGGTGDVIFSKASVAAAETATFEIVVNVDCGITNGAVIDNTVTAASATADPDSNNNSATEPTATEPAVLIGTMSNGAIESLYHDAGGLHRE